MLKNVFIVEDEKPNADRLKRIILKVRPDIQILGVEDSVVSSISWLSRHEAPDLIMMDVRLADGLSFEIFKHVNISCPVIFTTAYDEYAVKAFKHNGVDYLLKPIEEDELREALNKCDSMLVNNNETAFSIEGLLNQLQPKNYRSRFLLPYRDGYKSILTEHIAYFHSELGVNRAQLFDGNSESIPQTLEELEKQLDPKIFFRANRQFIVNIQAVAHIHNYFNGKLKLDLHQNPETEILVSREKAPLLKSWMDY